jgi:hypothetical protein
LQRNLAAESLGYTLCLADTFAINSTPLICTY